MSHLIIFKIVSIVVRTAARPIVSWITHYKKQELQSSDSSLHKFFRVRAYLIGQKVNKYNSIINRRMFGLPKDSVKLLSEQKAIDKGAEVMSELFLYTILLGLPILEWVRSSRESKEIEQNKEKFLRRLKTDMRNLEEENLRLKLEIGEVKQEILAKIEAKKKAQLEVKKH